MSNNVSKTSYSAIVVVVVAAAAVSSVWYSPLLLGKQWMELRSLKSAGIADTAMPAWKMLVDLVREFVVVYVLARFVSRLGFVDWKGTLSLGFWAWLVFPVQMLVGSSLWITSHGCST